MKRPKSKSLVRSNRSPQPMTIESVVGNAVWCTWTEDGQLRRGVFAKKELEAITRK